MPSPSKPNPSQGPSDVQLEVQCGSFIFYWDTVALQSCVKFLLYNRVNQPHVYIYAFPLEPPSHSLRPRPHPRQVITEHQAELPVLCSSFPLAVYLTHGSVYMPALLSQFIPLSPFPTVCSHVHSLICIFISFLQTAPWKESYDKPRQRMQKQRYHFANKGSYSQSYGFFQ